MDVFVATSRGKHMAEHFNKGNRAIFAFQKSATLQELGALAGTIINQNKHLYQDVSHIHPNIVYVIGGLPDTTHMLTDNHYHLSLSRVHSQIAGLILPYASSAPNCLLASIQS